MYLDHCCCRSLLTFSKNCGIQRDRFLHFFWAVWPLGTLFKQVFTSLRRRNKIWIATCPNFGCLDTEISSPNYTSVSYILKFEWYHVKARKALETAQAQYILGVSNVGGKTSVTYLLMQGIPCNWHPNNLNSTLVLWPFILPLVRRLHCLVFQVDPALYKRVIWGMAQPRSTLLLLQADWIKPAISRLTRNSLVHSCKTYPKQGLIPSIPRVRWVSKTSESIRVHSQAN